MDFIGQNRARSDEPSDYGGENLLNPHSYGATQRCSAAGPDLHRNDTGNTRCGCGDPSGYATHSG